MKIKFKQDYIGRETCMSQYYKDNEADILHQAAIELIDFGIAEPVKDKPKKAKEVTYGKNPQ